MKIKPEEISQVIKSEIESFEKAVKVEKNPANKAHFTGYMLVHLYPSNREMLMEARSYFEEALRLQPHLDIARTWLNRVNQALGDVPKSEQ